MTNKNYYHVRDEFGRFEKHPEYRPTPKPPRKQGLPDIVRTPEHFAAMPYKATRPDAVRQRALRSDYGKKKAVDVAQIAPRAKHVKFKPVRGYKHFHRYRIGVAVTDDVYHLLVAEAQERGIAVAAVVREVIDAGLAPE